MAPCYATPQTADYLVLKTIQLYEMVVVRHGLMVVGQPYGGKTSSWQLLASSLTFLAETRHKLTSGNTDALIAPAGKPAGEGAGWG